MFKCDLIIKSYSLTIIFFDTIKSELNMNSRKKFHWTQKNSMMVMGSLYDRTLWGTSFDPDPRLRNKFTSLQAKTQVLNDSVVYKYGKAPHIATLTIGTVKGDKMANKLQALLLLTVAVFVAEGRRNVATLFCNDIRTIR